MAIPDSSLILGVMTSSQIEIFEFKNGLKTIIEKRNDTENVHLGLIINVGSRNELKSEFGMAHLIEHLLFKGTEKHNAHYILNRIDSIGGELNAYTTKEKTVVHISVNKKYSVRAVDLLSEIFLYASFPENQIKKEKEVIKDEVKSYLDNPYEQIYDDFEELFFFNHPLSHPILGNKKSLSKISRSQIIKFYKKYYLPNNCVISIIGPLDIIQIKNILLNKFIRGQSKRKTETLTKKFNYIPFKKVISKNTHQAHCIIGNIAFSLNHKNRIAFILLNNMLGGPAMNSRLNMNIRERYGYTYAIESQYIAYSDVGIFSVYFGADKNYLEKTIFLILKELAFFRSKKISRTMLIQAKNQLCGQISLSNDNYVSTMLANGKSLLYFNKVISYKELYEKINAITAEEIYECAQFVFAEKKLSYLTYI